MIEVGEYVRTRMGDIAKVIENKDELVLSKIIKFYGIYRTYLNEDELNFIEKHSKNIIDLIEVGDYVNGYRILEKTKIKNNEMQICILKDNNCSNWRTVNDKTLKSIVTKEQFASMEYRVKEE